MTLCRARNPVHYQHAIMGDAPREPASRLVQLERDDTQIVLVVERREEGTPSGEVELARVVLPLSVLVDAVQRLG